MTSQFYSAILERLIEIGMGMNIGKSKFFQLILIVIFIFYISATLYVSSNHSGAKVYLGGNTSYRGELVGESGDESNPLIVDGLDNRVYSVQLVYPNYMIYYTNIDLSSSSEAKLNVRLSWKKYEVYGRKKNIKVRIKQKNLAPFAVDYDLNGTVDLVVGKGNGKIELFKNSSKKRFRLDKGKNLKSEGEVIQLTAPVHPFVVDFDNDGDFDLLVGDGDGLVWLFENQGDFSNLAHGEVLEADSAPIQVSGNFASPWVVDYDEDGLKDLVVSAGDGFAYKFLNIGSDDSPIFTKDGLAGEDTKYGAINFGGPSVVGFYDADRDGVMDIFASTSDGLLKIWLLGEDGFEFELYTYHKDSFELLDAGDSASVSICDVNNDGQIDLVFGNSTNKLFYYQSSHLDGDIVWDGKVDGADWARLRTALGCSNSDKCYLPDADLNEDDIVDSEDEAILLANFGRTY